MQHYICKGGCNGVTDAEHATCQAADCQDHGRKLLPCDCTDGMHKPDTTKDDAPTEA